MPNLYAAPNASVWEEMETQGKEKAFEYLISPLWLELAKCQIV